VNTASVNKGVQILLPPTYFIFLGYEHSTGIVGSYASSVPNTVFQMSVLIHISTSIQDLLF
jgi:hypothetical protein